MKCRNGFVSNSSSSSFILYGVKFIESNDIALKLYKALHSQIEEIEEIDDFELNLCEILEEADLGDFEIYTNYDDYCSYIGYGIDKMSGDETKNQFMLRVQSELTKLLHFEVLDKKELPRFGWYQETWYDG